jgi:excinuclease ABC subunit C
LITDDTIHLLPESSGVYIFRDGNGRIIYIGKAKSIRDRVRSYFRERGRDTKTERLVRNIEQVEVVLTGSEKEAFLLENNLIKEHVPRYNLDLKDDKTYVSLKLSVKESYPGLYVTRKIEDDGSLYFGPYTSARDVRDVLKMLQSLYPIRRCKNSVFRKRKRACMLAELGKCLAPCEERVSEVAYRTLVNEVADFLSGRDEKVLKALEEGIAKAAQSWNFEEARALKERYLAIKGMTERQSVHEHFGKNRDVWAFLESERGVGIVMLAFRRGVLIAKKGFKEALMTVGFNEAVSSFLFRYYSRRPIPDEIVLSEEIGDTSTLEQYLRELRKGPLRILGPSHRGVADVVKLAIENLHEVEPVVLEEAFKKALHLAREPLRIEAYDVSHIHGTNPSGVMVVFEGFKAKKAGYRVFHIRGDFPMDDVASISEVLMRRVADQKLGPFPDLFVIDGGKGQVAAAVKVLKEALVDRDVVGIAKGQGRRRMEDLIYIPNRKNPLLFPKASPVFKELLKIRDEAHRFAVASHRRRRRKADLK